jgi:glycosyltransferase 2 family protein
MKSSLWRHAWRWLPGVIISIIALFVLSRLVSWGDLVRSFSSLNPLVVVVAVLLTVCSSMARTQTWRILLGSRVKYWRTFHILNIGFMLNNLFPLRAGEFGRAVLMGRSSGLGTFHVLSTIVIERTYDMVVIAGMLLATLPLVLGIKWAQPFTIAIMGVMLLGLFCLHLLARYKSQVDSWITGVAGRFPWVRRVVMPRVASLLDGLGVLTSPQKMAESVFWILVTWFIYNMVTFVVLALFVPHPPFWWAFFLNGAAALGVAVPAAPGGIGVYEASIVGALSFLQVSTSQALAFALVIHLLNWITTFVMGIVGLSRLGYSFSELSSGIQSSGSSISNQ